MKLKEQREAVKLRKFGNSIGDIAQILSVSKGSVSRWVYDIELTNTQLKQIERNSHTDAVIEKRRKTRIINETRRRNTIINKAEEDIRALSHSELFFLGIALFWGEGTKKKRGVVEFTNSDPHMIKTMMVFLRTVCLVRDYKFRGHVYLHEHLSIKKAERYWSTISGIPLKQFHKTSIQHNRKRTQKDNLPNGTFAILVCDTELKLKIDGWIKGVYQRVCL